MTEPVEPFKEIIKAIHDAPLMVVINFAGAGSEALCWLHEVEGSSRTVLEAIDHYAAASLVDCIGFKPEKFAAQEVARAMALYAYGRACELAEVNTPVAGIGSTATIATDRTKRGDHEVYVAVCDDQSLTGYALKMVKGHRSRAEEETLVSRLILGAVADACSISDLPPPPLLPEEIVDYNCKPVDWLDYLLSGTVNWVSIAPDGRARPGHTWPHTALLSGAFNPLHYGHRQLAQAAAEKLGREIHFELPLVNADKAPLDLDEAHQRVAQFVDFAGVIVTQMPLFNQKARFFPHSTFVIGVDTAQRLWQPRFYNDDPLQMYAAFNEIRAAGCSFLVAGRSEDDQFITLSDIEIPPGYRDLFTELPADEFRIDISSTAIRTGAVDT